MTSARLSLDGTSFESLAGLTADRHESGLRRVTCGMTPGDDDRTLT
jgi:hypothetical protein